MYLKICILSTQLLQTQKLGSLYKRHTKSDNGCSYWPQKLKRKQSKPTDENMDTTNSRLPVWIVNHSSEIDSKRFLIEWLSASVQDVPLVVYQSSKGPSMYLLNNFNHQIYPTDLLILYAARNFLLSNLLILFIFSNRKKYR